MQFVALQVCFFLYSPITTFFQVILNLLKFNKKIIFAPILIKIDIQLYFDIPNLKILSDPLWGQCGASLGVQIPGPGGNGVNF